MNLSSLPKHHALLITSEDRATATNTLWEELRAISPAHTLYHQTVLDIDTARAIIAWANTPYNEEKIALISFHTAGIPAQNAMLKILEEPRAGVRFILLTSNKENLLPTVVSRLHQVQTKNEERRMNNYAQEFLNTKPTMRMKLPFVVEMLAKEDEMERKDREGAREFVLQLADYIVSQKGASKKYAEKTFEFASYISDPSSSTKAILEYLSLSLPQAKN